MEEEDASGLRAMLDRYNVCVCVCVCVCVYFCCITGGDVERVREFPDIYMNKHTHTHTNTHTYCYLAGGDVEGVGEFPNLVILRLHPEVLERASEREVFAKRIPPQMALLYELLQV